MFPMHCRIPRCVRAVAFVLVKRHAGILTDFWVAGAYAEAGQFDKAVEWRKKAIELVKSST